MSGYARGGGGATGPLRVAALVKQVPVVEEMALGPDGRLRRDGVALEMSAYCRRAVAKGVELARSSGGSCVAITLGPPPAEQVLREAVAFGADHGVLVSDPAFAGSDTLATARALAAALDRAALEWEGHFDLVLVGRNSVDADTGQVGPAVAELLGLPFATGVRHLIVVEGSVEVRCEHDDETVSAAVGLPAVLSTAERLCDPCKIKDPDIWATVDSSRLHRLTAADLGPGPWGAAASPTTVGATRTEAVDRAAVVLSGPVEDQVRRAIDVFLERGLLHPAAPADVPPVPRAVAPAGAAVGVLMEPDRERLTRQLLGSAARLAVELGGRVVAVGPAPLDPAALGRWGADEVVEVSGAEVEEDVAGAVTGWVTDVQPEVVLAGGTAWGREVASRAAAATGSGLTGDAVGLGVDHGRLVAWKPAFGGSLVAAVTASSPVQMATVRPGVLPMLEPRPAPVPPTTTVTVEPRRRVVVQERVREDDLDVLAEADVVIGVGQGVDPEHYGELDGLRHLLGAELAATRKVTDQGWMPRARQVGITGHSIAPRLYLAVAASGKFNHTVGFRSAGFVVALNAQPDAPVFAAADLGLVGDWREIVPALETALSATLSAPAGAW